MRGFERLFSLFAVKTNALLEIAGMIVCRGSIEILLTQVGFLARESLDCHRFSLAERHYNR